MLQVLSINKQDTCYITSPNTLLGNALDTGTTHKKKTDLHMQSTESVPSEKGAGAFLI